MSYYQKIDKWILTHHAQRRIKERIDLKKIPTHDVYEYICQLIDDSIIDYVFDNGDVRLKNLENKIEFIIRNNLVKTVINKR